MLPGRTSEIGTDAPSQSEGKEERPGMPVGSEPAATQAPAFLMRSTRTPTSFQAASAPEKGGSGAAASPEGLAFALPALVLFLGGMIPYSVLERQHTGLMLSFPNVQELSVSNLI